MAVANDAGERAALRIGVLGPLALTVSSGPLEVRGTIKRAALALLALHAGTAVPLSRVAARVWGDDPPAHARSLLRSTLAELRAVLDGEPGGQGGLRVSDFGCCLDVPAPAVDLLRSRRLAEQGRAALRERAVERAAHLLGQARDLWRGPALCDVVLPEGSWPELAELHEEQLALREDRLAAELDLGRPEPVIDELRGLIRDEPLRERLHGLLMRALVKVGRTREALEVYDEVAAVLADEWGIDPCAELRDLRDGLSPGAAQLGGRAVAGDMTASAVMFGLSGLPPCADDPEPLARLLDAVNQQIAEQVQRCGAAMVVPLQGPTVLAVFDHAQHARCAVQCALAVLDAVQAPASGATTVRLRAAIASGAVCARDGAGRDGLVLAGGAFDACHRMLAVVAPGGLLVDDATRRAVGDQVRSRASRRPPRTHEVLGEAVPGHGGEGRGCARATAPARRLPGLPLGLSRPT